MDFRQWFYLLDLPLIILARLLTFFYFGTPVMYVGLFFCGVTLSMLGVIPWVFSTYSIGVVLVSFLYDPFQALLFDMQLEIYDTQRINEFLYSILETTTFALGYIAANLTGFYKLSRKRGEQLLNQQNP
jgi:hypothetical protein